MARLGLPFQIVGVAAAFAFLWHARTKGPLWSSLHAYLILGAIVLVAWRTIDLIRGQLSLRAYRQARAHAPQLAAVGLRVVVWLLVALAVDVGMPHARFRYQDETTTKGWIAAGILVLTALLPRQRRWAPGDVLFGALLGVLGLDVGRALIDRESHALDVAPPFDRSMYVLNAGAGPLVNEHARYPGWTGATDLFPRTFGGGVCSGNGLRAYPCFGAAVLAPVSGRIAHVVNDRPDMRLGELDYEVPSGNSVSIETNDGRYLLLAHLMQSTIRVRVGERVTAGQELARCGNSGVASMPHLLLQAQDRPAPLQEGRAPRTFPLRFVDAVRVRGEERVEGPFAVRRNDVIVPLGSDDENAEEDDESTDDGE